MEQAKSILEEVKKMYDTAKNEKTPCYQNIQDFDEKIVLNVARWASADISPVCAFFGGIIAQEIIKTTGKYIPIDQWLMFDFFEAAENLGELADGLDNAVKEINSQYTDGLFVVTDLFDIWVSDGIKTYLENGGKVKVTFNTKYAEKPIVLHRAHNGEWEVIDPNKVTLNEDGKILVEFTSLSPVAFLSPSEDREVNPPAEKNCWWIWIIIIIIVTLIIVLIILLKKKKDDDEEEAKAETTDEAAAAAPTEAIADEATEEAPADETSAENAPVEEAPAEEEPKTEE